MSRGHYHVGFTVTAGERDRIDQYAKVHHFGNRSEALRALVQRGLMAQTRHAV